MNKILLFVTLCMGSLFCAHFPDAIADGYWTEEEIRASDYEEEYYDFYLLARVPQLIREAEFLHYKTQFDASYKCYEDAGYMVKELVDHKVAYGHLCPNLIAGLCFENSSKVNQPLAKECYKKCYERALSYDYKIEGPFEYIFALPSMYQGAYAAYLYGDEEAFAQLLFMQMDLCDTKTFTYFIYYMEELQLLAYQKLSEDHWIHAKMEQQMEQKLDKEHEMEYRLETIVGCSRGGLISLFKDQYCRRVNHGIIHLEQRLPQP